MERYAVSAAVTVGRGTYTGPTSWTLGGEGGARYDFVPPHLLLL